VRDASIGFFSGRQESVSLSFGKREDSPWWFEMPRSSEAGVVEPSRWGLLLRARGGRRKEGR
jgi:hypothetical protein